MQQKCELLMSTMTSTF